MNWEAIGAIGEAVGAIGIIVTLGYLAIQIRQNTIQQRSQVIQVMFESYSQLIMLLVSDAELGRMFLAGTLDQSSLTDEELVRFQLFMMAFLRRLENFYIQSSNGGILDEEFASFRETTFDFLARPGSREFWKMSTGRFNPKFADWVTSALAKRDN